MQSSSFVQCGVAELYVTSRMGGRLGEQPYCFTDLLRDELNRVTYTAGCRFEYQT